MKMRGEGESPLENKAQLELKKMKLEIEKIKAEKEDQEQVSVRTAINAVAVVIVFIILSILTCNMHSDYRIADTEIKKAETAEKYAAPKLEAAAKIREKEAILTAAKAKLQAESPIGKEEVEVLLNSAIAKALEAREKQLAEAANKEKAEKK